MEKKENSRSAKEVKVLRKMIEIYCRGHKHTSDGQLCSSCKALLLYARERSAKCPFGENKSFCNNCTIHCYKPEMREQIRKVMRYSGPRSIFYHPILMIQHIIETKKQSGRST